MKITIRKVLVSSGFLALFPALLFVIFLHPDNPENFLRINEVRRIDGQYMYADLGNDSVSDIIFSTKETPYNYIMAYNKDYQVYDQWNLKDSINSKISSFFLGDYDQDHKKEVYIFTNSKDSLFLNANEFLEKNGLLLDRIFICTIGYAKGDVASMVIPAGFYDENGDGYNELYFFVNSEYRLGPRRLLRYDIKNRTLETSEFTATIPNFNTSEDADNDGKPEFFGTISASGNYSRLVPYSDSSTWFMVFNEKLKFEFPPVEFPGFANGLYINAYKNGSFSGYLLTHIVGGTDTTVMSPRLMIWSSDGKLVRYKVLKELANYKYPLPVLIRDRNNNSDRVYLIAGGDIQELDDNLNVIRKVLLNATSYVVSFTTDLNFDGVKEIMVYSEEDRRVWVLDPDLKILAETEVRTPDVWWKFSEYSPGDSPRRLFMTSAHLGYFIDFHKNKWYYAGFLYYPGIYILFLLFIVVVKKIAVRQIEGRESIKRRLLALQLQSIKGQMDPHFTFNALNSIASLIYLEDRHKAYDYMNKFTQLLRTMLNDAERIYRSLSEELIFVNTYLELEKLRFGEMFSYSIELGPGVTKKEQVPKLVLHTFVENSLKHGIMPKEGGGILKIVAEIEGDYLKLIIEDNGVGFSSSQVSNTNTGKGLKLTGEFYDILNQINKKPIRHSISDICDENGNISGTRVEVQVPLSKEE